MSDTYRNSRAGGRRFRQSSSADRIMAVQNARSRGTGSRRGGSGRRRGRRQGPDMAKIVLIVIGVLILLICAAVGFQSCARSEDDKTSVESESETETTEPETEMAAEITVNGVQVHGLTKTEAIKKVLEDMGWEMKVSFGDETADLPNLMEANVDAVIEKAFAKKESGDYTVETDGLDDAVQVEVKALAAKWDVEPKNGSISTYDKSSDKFTFAGAQTGKKIDQEKLTSDILSAMKAGEYNKTITATADEVQPEITEAQARENFKRIGTYTTKTTTNKDRNENIRLACAAINGTIIKPGEEFSFNKMTGNRTTEKGYKPAGAYSNGVVVQEPGGGVCQVSTTLYNALLEAELQIDVRYPHSMEVSYVKPSKDAAIATGSKDLVFTNNKEYPIYIEGTTNGYEVSFTIYGKEDRPSNRKVEYISVEDKRIPSYAIEVPDASIPSGTYRSGGGSNHDEVYSHLEKVVYENGQEVSRETLHSDHYAASNETVYVGTGAAAPTDGT